MKNILFFTALLLSAEINCGPYNSKEKASIEKFNSKKETLTFEEKIMSESEQKIEFDKIGALGKIAGIITSYDIYMKIKRKEKISEEIKKIITSLSKIKSVKSILSDNAVKFIVKNHIYSYKKNHKINILEDLKTVNDSV